MTALDAFGGERFHRTEILREPDGGDDPRQLSRRFDLQYGDECARGRVDFHRATDEADRQRQLDGASQIALRRPLPARPRSEEHTSELQSLMRISYAVFCLTKKNN